ncbi:hypothetical protein PDE_07052 [Penicillium oxalicum 114-2]|uniref:Uncharacterized protein n=1 Tax=Penicillium oxalicum (strain 114-2 / CGMCC 5302) TaxID=933388 RepID=S8B035_PENO1|nr:hypothetical protein PDE_07052 [Penicillium oxalicum 114-2]
MISNERCRSERVAEFLKSPCPLPVGHLQVILCKLPPRLLCSRLVGTLFQRLLCWHCITGCFRLLFSLEKPSRNYLFVDPLDVEAQVQFIIHHYHSHPPPPHFPVSSVYTISEIISSGLVWITSRRRSVHPHSTCSLSTWKYLCAAPHAAYSLACGSCRLSSILSSVSDHSDQGTLQVLLSDLIQTCSDPDQPCWVKPPQILTIHYCYLFFSIPRQPPQRVCGLPDNPRSLVPEIFDSSHQNLVPLEHRRPPYVRIHPLNTVSTTFGTPQRQRPSLRRTPSPNRTSSGRLRGCLR